jgi:hypothetical protein
MADVPGILLAYDAEGNVVGSLESLVARDEEGRAIGLVDFMAHEAQGGKFRLTEDRGIWNYSGAVGSGVWPEWLGPRAAEFKVELDRRHKHPIRRLVHRQSGHVRDRAQIEQAISDRADAAGEEPVDLRDIVGGPGRPIPLDADGRTAPPLRRHLAGVPLVRPDGSSPTPPGPPTRAAGEQAVDAPAPRGRGTR